MASGGTGDDPLQSARSSDDGKASESPSVSSRVGQLFSSLTSAATASISNLTPSRKLAAPSKPTPLPTPLPATCEISEGAAALLEAKILSKPRPPPKKKKMQQYPLPPPLCLPCPNYAVIGLLNNVLWATSLPSNASDRGVKNMPIMSAQLSGQVRKIYLRGGLKLCAENITPNTAIDFGNNHLPLRHLPRPPQLASRMVQP